MQDPDDSPKEGKAAKELQEEMKPDQTVISVRNHNAMEFGLSKINLANAIFSDFD
jgi:hypothetical protein